MLEIVISLAIGWLAGNALAVGIIIERYNLATWFTRINLFCAVVVIAHTLAQLLS